MVLRLLILLLFGFALAGHGTKLDPKKPIAGGVKSEPAEILCC